MTNCLDCGYLHQHSMWNGEDKEYSKTCRDRLGGILEGIASGEYGLEHDPRYLCCHLNLPGFPGRDHSAPHGLAVSHNPNEQKRHVRQMRQTLEALTQDWDCQYYTPHQPGFTPRQHSQIQARHAWEEKQEQARRAWERAQHEESQRFQEGLIEKQERFESHHRRVDRWIGFVAIVVSIVSCLISLLTLLLE